MAELTREEIFRRIKKIQPLVNAEDWAFWDELAKEYKEQPQQIVTEDQLPETLTVDVTERPRIGYFNALDLIDKDLPKQEWLVENLIPSVGFTAVTGAPFSYKSFITEHLAVAITNGEMAFNHFPTKQSAVLIIDKENNLPLLKDRFKKLGSNKKLFFLDNPDSFNIQNPKDLAWLHNFIELKDIKLIIIDSFAHIHKGDENDSMAVVQTFEQLKLIGIPILFIHHHRKAIKFFTGTILESIRGSSDISAELECHIALDTLSDGSIRITQGKNRWGELLKPFRIQPIITEAGAVFEYMGDIEEVTSKRDEAIQLITSLLSSQGEVSRKQLIESLVGDVGETAIDNAVKEMEANKQLNIRFEGRTKMISMSQGMSFSTTSEISPLEQSYLDDIDSMS